MIRGPKHFFTRDSSVERRHPSPLRNTSNTWRTPNAYTKRKIDRNVVEQGNWRRDADEADDADGSDCEICAIQSSVLTAD